MKKGSQRSQSQPPAPEYGLACGVVFFVSGDLDVARPTITRLGTSLLDLLGQASDDASAAAFAKRSKTRWKQFAESVSFESTERFTAVRSSAKEYQAGQLTMVGANASPGCLNLPSFIYAELPQSTDDQQIIGVMVDAVASGHVFLALSDVVLADNPKDY
ncbi:MAG: hypothetical protein KDB00_30145, partial [Planctomycetales bacterium]|nr:hypothetical protein [Planctomycetales bacterium]